MTTSSSNTVTGSDSSSIDPLQNFSSPYFRLPSENPAIVLVTPVLNGPNYHTWSRAMKMALKSKNKLQFVDGTIRAPPTSDSLYSSWLRCNTMVCSWITRSLSPTIARSILWLDKAYDIWSDLKDRFSQSDIFRVAELQDEIYSLKQGDLSVSEFFTKLKILWDEFVTLRPITRCSCNFTCSCVVYQQQDYALRFLKGLNERFTTVKSQIMLLDPLPSVNKIFSMILQQEREMHLGVESTILFNKGPSRPSGAPASFGSGSSGTVFSGSGSKNFVAGGSSHAKFCTFCNRPRHTVDTCYRKHGFPPGFKFRNQSSASANNFQSQVPLPCMIKSKNRSPGILSTPSTQFTPEQYQKLLELVKSNVSSTPSIHNVQSLPSSHQNSGKSLQCPPGMDLDENVTEIEKDEDHAWTLFVHAFNDLTRVSPVVFVYLLKEAYLCGKATTKFQALQHQVYLVLHNDPKPGPAAFAVQCLYVSSLYNDCSNGFSNLIMSAFGRFLKKTTKSEISLEAKGLATCLFIDIVGGRVCHDERILVKILETFDIKLNDIEKVTFQSKAMDDSSHVTAQELMEKYIFELGESQLYATAVTLMERFSIFCFGKSFLVSMIQSNQFKAAEKWATFMGKPMLGTLVEEYCERNLLKNAYEIIMANNLQQDFPDAYRKCKESSIKKLAGKGLWDLAEARTNGDKQLIEYLVYLATEAGYTEKIDELCDRYSLERILQKVLDRNIQHKRYLHLDELFVEDTIWVDEYKGLLDATSQIEGCKVIGVDSEWKPNHVKGSKPNKASILQIASERVVFIFDLIKLHQEVPDILDDCLTRILQSPVILKLGYNFQCDMKQLSHSYKELKCFKHFESMLDVQQVFKSHHGGLAGLAEKILGAGLNKTSRNSDWEQRPLSQYQLEYAALDAAVLIRIFSHVSGEGGDKFEWQSYIESHNKNTKKSKKCLKLGV